MTPMKPYSIKNCVTLTYDTPNKVGEVEDGFNYRSVSCLVKQVLIDKITRIPNIHIHDVKIPMSGGIDSECVAETFFDAGIHFTVPIMRYYINGMIYNYHDIEYAISWCETNSVIYEFYDLDIEDFFETGKHLAYCDYKCVSPQMACHLWLLDQINQPFSFIALPLDLPHINSAYMCGDIDGANINLVDMKHGCYYNYFAQNEVFGIPNIFLLDKMVINTVLNAQYAAESSTVARDTRFRDYYQWKCAIYAAAGFRARPRFYKLTGFEYIRAHYSIMSDEVYTFREFDKRFRQPMLDIVGWDNKYVTEISQELVDFVTQWTKWLYSDDLITPKQFLHNA